MASAYKPLDVNEEVDKTPLTSQATPAGILTQEIDTGFTNMRWNVKNFSTKFSLMQFLKKNQTELSVLHNVYIYLLLLFIFNIFN